MPARIKDFLNDAIVTLVSAPPKGHRYAERYTLLRQRRLNGRTVAECLAAFVVYKGKGRRGGLRALAEAGFVSIAGFVSAAEKAAAEQAKKDAAREKRAATLAARKSQQVPTVPAPTFESAESASAD